LKVREIEEETELEIKKTEELNLARQKVAAELSEKLRELKLSNSESTQKGSHSLYSVFNGFQFYFLVLMLGFLPRNLMFLEAILSMSYGDFLFNRFHSFIY